MTASGDNSLSNHSPEESHLAAVMTTSIAIPDFAVVTLLFRKREAPVAVFDGIENGTKIIGDVNKPDLMLAEVRAALVAGRSPVVYLRRSHAKSRRDLSRAAHKAGARSVAVMIEDIGEFDADAEKHDQFYDLRGADLSAIEIKRTPMPADLTELAGPFDIIGDIHGCADELMDLLVELGHAVLTEDGPTLIPHPQGRRVCLVGDLTDRGPQNLRAVRIAHQLHQEFGGIIVLGNHDAKLARWLRGADVRVAAGLALTISEFEQISLEARKAYADWLDSLFPHYSLDGGRLIVAHAGLKEDLHGSSCGKARAFAMYGKTDGEVDEEGAPVQIDWAIDYSGTATVVHGHVVTAKPRILNNVVSVDTGCVFGGSLTAYRYPEREFVAVPARETYFEKRGPWSA